MEWSNPYLPHARFQESQRLPPFARRIASTDPAERTRQQLRQGSSPRPRPIGRDRDVLSFWRACRPYAFVCAFQMTRYSLATFHGEVRELCSASRSCTSLGTRRPLRKSARPPRTSIKTRTLSIGKAISGTGGIWLGKRRKGTSIRHKDADRVTDAHRASYLALAPTASNPTEAGERLSLSHENNGSIPLAKFQSVSGSTLNTTDKPSGS